MTTVISVIIGGLIGTFIGCGLLLLAIFIVQLASGERAAKKERERRSIRWQSLHQNEEVPSPTSFHIWEQEAFSGAVCLYYSKKIDLITGRPK